MPICIKIPSCSVPFSLPTKESNKTIGGTGLCAVLAAWAVDC